jgi:hypothetical protein
MPVNPLLADVNDDVDESEETEPNHEVIEDTDETNDDEPLGEAGLKALREERKKARKLEAEIRKLKAAKPDASSAKNEDKIRDEIRAEIAREYGSQILSTEAEAELVAAGFKGNTTRGVKLLILDDIDFTDKEGRREAVRDAIAELREESPEFFRRTRTRDDAVDEDDEPKARRQAPGSADLGRKKAKSTGANPLEQALSQMVGLNKPLL